MTLRVDECWAGYHARAPVLRGLSGSFPTGSLSVIVGPNGCGKTTLLRVLAGLLTPLKGRVTLDGKPVGSWSRADRAAHLAFVPQRSGAPLGFTAQEMVEMGVTAGRPGLTRGERGARVEAALRLADAATGSEKPFAALSAGQQQRVGIARALGQLGPVPNGRTLLADEPTAWLDPPHAVRTMETLAGLAHQGVCVVCVLHDLALARRFADDALLLGPDGGVIAWERADGALRPERLEAAFGARFIDVESPAGRLPIALGPAGEPDDRG